MDFKSLFDFWQKVTFAKAGFSILRGSNFVLTKPKFFIEVNLFE